MENRNIPNIKKELKKFLVSEEGKIVEKSAVKLGVTLLAVAGIVSGIMKPSDVNADCLHGSHSSHGSHGSHGNHGRGGGWC
jgi:hypothetical protein